MPHQIRYGAYVREVSLKQRQISFNDIVPEIEKDALGNDLPYHPPKLILRRLDVIRLIKPAARPWVPPPGG